MESSLNPAARDALRGVSALWWLWIVFGVAWIAISATTVGVLIGLMFLATAVQQMAIGACSPLPAGIWALLHGVTDLMRAFYIRQLGKLV